MRCEECFCEMEFDDEIWSWVCLGCGDEVELEPGEEPAQLDLSEDEED